VGSYLAHGPEIYPKAHKNPRAFSCISGPIYLEFSIQCPCGVGLHHLPSLRISNTVIVPPMYIHNIHPSQWHHQHQHHLISMSSSTSTSYHLNVIININIISYQYHYQHLHHHISILSSTSTTSRPNIFNITNNHIPHIYI